jgi:hypothetical protein
MLTVRSEIFADLVVGHDRARWKRLGPNPAGWRGGIRRRRRDGRAGTVGCIRRAHSDTAIGDLLGRNEYEDHSDNADRGQHRGNRGRQWGDGWSIVIGIHVGFSCYFAFAR